MHRSGPSDVLLILLLFLCSLVGLKQLGGSINAARFPLRFLTSFKALQFFITRHTNSVPKNLEQDQEGRNTVAVLQNLLMFVYGPLEIVRFIRGIAAPGTDSITLPLWLVWLLLSLLYRLFVKITVIDNGCCLFLV